MTLSVQDAAREGGQKLALIAGETALNWSELADAVLRDAARLQAHGVATHGAWLSARPEITTVVRLLALFEMGRPVGLLDPRLGEEAAAQVSRATPRFDRVDGVPFDGEHSATPLPAVPDDERALAIVRSSGSSGSPRGIVLSRRAFVASARASATRLGWQTDDRWLVCLPLAHISGLSILTRCLMARRAIVLAPSADTDTIAEVITAQRVRLVSLVPAMLARLLDRESWKPPSWLRIVLLGGSGVSPSLLERARMRRVPVLVTYGMSETCSQVATQIPGTPPGPEQGAGPALPGVELHIRDGVIAIRTPSIASGVLTAEGTLTALPQVDAEGWLQTKDLGRLDKNGRLHITGRADELLISGGEKIDPTQVEHFLDRLSGVRESLVFGVSDERWGQRVAALIVADKEGSGLETLARALREGLPSAQRPRLIALVDALPRTYSGKLDRRAAQARSTQLKALPHLPEAPE